MSLATAIIIDQNDFSNLTVVGFSSNSIFSLLKENLKIQVLWIDKISIGRTLHFCDSTQLEY